MIYRPKLLEKLGYKEFPTTWNEVFELSDEALKIIKQLYSYSAPDILSTDIANITQAGLSVVHFQHILMRKHMDEALQGDLKLARLPKSPNAEGTTYWSSGPNILKHY